MQAALLALLPPPVVHQLVAGHGDQPRHGEVGDRVTLHRLRGGQERLGREVLGQDRVAGAGRQVAVHLRERVVVHVEECRALVAGTCLEPRHVLIIVAGRRHSDGL